MATWNSTIPGVLLISYSVPVQIYTRNKRVAPSHGQLPASCHHKRPSKSLSIDIEIRDPVPSLLQVVETSPFRWEPVIQRDSKIQRSKSPMGGA